MGFFWRGVIVGGILFALRYALRFISVRESESDTRELVAFLRQASDVAFYMYIILMLGFELFIFLFTGHII